MFQNNNTLNKLFKSKKWLLVIFISILLVIFLVSISFFYYQSKVTPATVSNNTVSITTSISSQSLQSESWSKNDNVLFHNRTSTSSIKVNSNIIRMYYQNDGKFFYVESSDGIKWGSAFQINIALPSNKMVSNPSVLKLSDNIWLLAYEQSPLNNGQNHGQPNSSNQRDIYTATSSDGKNFSNIRLSIDSSKSDGYFASVPDLILTPDNKIRMYYVTQGNAVGSVLSNDNGNTWTKEDFRLDGAVDPDVLYKNNVWVMYYSVLDDNTNAIFKANSEDGLTWTKDIGTAVAKVGVGHLVDPDVIEIGENNFIMYYGKFDITGNNPIDLYYAMYDSDIF